MSALLSILIGVSPFILAFIIHAARGFPNVDNGPRNG